MFFVFNTGSNYKILSSDKNYRVYEKIVGQIAYRL